MLVRGQRRDCPGGGADRLHLHGSLAGHRCLGWRFLVRDHWIPPDDLGALPFIYGTLWTSTMAMLIAVPLGIATAAFLAEIVPSGLRRAGSFLIELLAAIPSVVYGFWAIKFLGPLTKNMFLVLVRCCTSTATTCSRRASFWRS